MQASECPDNETAKTVVERSLIVRHLEEESVHQSILYTKLGECEYEILSVDPNDGTYFSIDSSTHQLTSVKFDRESAIFTEMMVPQFQIKMQLNCGNSIAGRAKRATEEDVSYVRTSDVMLATDVTVLNVIVEDINDNAPKFTYPLSNGNPFGYPNPETFDMSYFPSYLLKVQVCF